MSGSLLESRYAFSRFVERINSIIKSLNFAHHERPWFRGHSHREHELLPSLFRKNVLREACAPGSRLKKSDVLRLESDLFFEFQARLGREHLDNQSAWDIMFLMRHHGLPTRSLDWTEILGVAVHFAISGINSENASPTIWVLNPYAMNKHSWGFRDTVLPKYLGAPRVTDDDCDYDDVLAYGGTATLPFKMPVAICPSRSNIRMQAQAGSFTIHGTVQKPLEAQFDSSLVRAVPIPHDAIKGAHAFLKDAGLTTRVLFPGLDGLAREMTHRFS